MGEGCDCNRQENAYFYFARPDVFAEDELLGIYLVLVCAAETTDLFSVAHSVCDI